LRPHGSQQGRAITIALSIGLGSWACAGVVPETTPETRALQVERLQCEADTSDEMDAVFFRGMTVLAVEPVYSHIHNVRTGTELRVAGTKLVVRPPEPVDLLTFARILQCHSARAILGHLDRSRFPDDPFWLDGSWLDISLEPEAGNLAITVAADGVADNLLVLRRARAFGALRAPAL
jgi:hypothetical protein